MIRVVVMFTCAVAFLELTAGRKLLENHDFHENLVFQEEEEPKHNRSICSDHEAQMYAHKFHNCFFDRKYRDGGKDLDNIVDRILEHSRICVENVTGECRPHYTGFLVIIDKVISQMKDYCYMYLELITHGRDNIKDLKCVETSLSNDTYRSCFQEVFTEETRASEKKFHEKVEKAISCTNKSHKLCSKEAKTSLNRMVRTILGVEQPEKEGIEEDVKPKPPMKWYDYIIQPFVSMWNAIRSFFGF